MGETVETATIRVETEWKKRKKQICRKKMKREAKMMEIKINACPTFLFGWTLLDQGYSSLSEDGGTSRHKSKHANSHKDIFSHTVNDYNQKSNQIYIKTTMTKEVQKKK